MAALRAAGAAFDGPTQQTGAKKSTAEKKSTARRETGAGRRDRCRREEQVGGSRAAGVRGRHQSLRRWQVRRGPARLRSRHTRWIAERADAAHALLPRPHLPQARQTRLRRLRSDRRAVAQERIVGGRASRRHQGARASLQRGRHQRRAGSAAISFAEAPGLPGQSSNTPGSQTAMAGGGQRVGIGSGLQRARSTDTVVEFRRRRRFLLEPVRGRLFKRTKGGGAPATTASIADNYASPGRRKLELGRHNGSGACGTSAAARSGNRVALRYAGRGCRAAEIIGLGRRAAPARRRLRLPSRRVRRHRTPPPVARSPPSGKFRLQVAAYARARRRTRLQGSWSGATASNSVAANPKSTKPSSAAWAPSTGCALALTPAPRSPSSCVLRCAPTASTAWSLVRNIDARPVAEAFGGASLSSLTPGSNPWESPATWADGAILRPA